MKSKSFYSLLIVSITCLFFSLGFSNNRSTGITSIHASKDSLVCIVCGMKINMDEAYTWKYKDKKYYFNSYNCKTSFKINPEKFINNTCTPVK